MLCLFEFRQHLGGVRLAPHGEIDLSVVGKLREALDAAIRSGGGPIEIDLRSVTFMDCSGIGAIVASRNEARRAGEALFVSHPTGVVRRALALTGELDSLMASGVPRS